MTVALKQVGRKESELELVLERHSEFPRLIAVNIDANASPMILPLIPRTTLLNGH